jgi:hypothetical protein
MCCTVPDEVLGEGCQVPDDRLGMGSQVPDELLSVGCQVPDDRLGVVDEMAGILPILAPDKPPLQTSTFPES